MPLGALCHRRQVPGRTLNYLLTISSGKRSQTCFGPNCSLIGIRFNLLNQVMKKTIHVSLAEIRHRKRKIISIRHEMRTRVQTWMRQRSNWTRIESNQINLHRTESNRTIFNRIESGDNRIESESNPNRIESEPLASGFLFPFEWFIRSFRGPFEGAYEDFRGKAYNLKDLVQICKDFMRIDMDIGKDLPGLYQGS